MATIHKTVHCNLVIIQVVTTELTVRVRGGPEGSEES